MSQQITPCPSCEGTTLYRAEGIGAAELGAMLDAMEQPDLANVDYFGARLTAWLTPPQTGAYTFWTATR